jgi:hypothetical protein
VAAHPLTSLKYSEIQIGVGVHVAARAQVTGETEFRHLIS